MLGLLYRLLIGTFKTCDHKWEKVAEFKLYADQGKRMMGVKYVLQCKNCGNIKDKEIYG